MSIIAVIYQSAGGRAMHPTLPVAFKRRTKFLRRCFNQIDALARYRDEMLSILDGISGDLVKLRNTVIHDSVHDFDPETGVGVALRGPITRIPPLSEGL